LHAEERARLLDERVVRALGLFGRHRLLEARPAAAPHVAVERELAHDEERAPDVRYREVHLACIVLEDAEARDLREYVGALGVAVAAPDTEVDEEAALDGADDGAVDFHLRPVDPLDDRPQRPPTCAEVPCLIPSSFSSRAVISKYVLRS